MLLGAGLLYVGMALPGPGLRAGVWLTIGFAVVVGLKLVAAGSAPPLGLKATYWARATPEGPAERSTDFPWLADATRIDTQLDLRGEAFPVHFFNDAARFNFGSEVQPGRDQLPFVVRWQGWLLAGLADWRNHWLPILEVKASSNQIAQQCADACRYRPGS